MSATDDLTFETLLRVLAALPDDATMQDIKSAVFSEIIATPGWDHGWRVCRDGASVGEELWASPKASRPWGEP
jgi:hypothetical protein